MLLIDFYDGRLIEQRSGLHQGHNYRGATHRSYVRSGSRRSPTHGCNPLSVQQSSPVLSPLRRPRRWQCDGPWPWCWQCDGPWLAGLLVPILWLLVHSRLLGRSQMSGLLVCAGQQSPVSSAIASHVPIPRNGQLDEPESTVVHLLRFPLCAQPQSTASKAQSICMKSTCMTARLWHCGRPVCRLLVRRVASRSLRQLRWLGGPLRRPRQRLALPGGCPPPEGSLGRREQGSWTASARLALPSGPWPGPAGTPALLGCGQTPAAALQAARREGQHLQRIMASGLHNGSP